MLLETPFKHCPKCGSAGFEAVAQNLLKCGACGFRHHLNPVVAVDAILLDSSQRVLLIRRAKEPGKGKLAMPGGFVDLGETAEMALEREIKEEVNVDFFDVRYLTSHPNRYLYQGFHIPVLDLFYTARVRSWDAAKALAEVESFSICHPNEVDPRELAFESMAQAWARFRAIPVGG